MQSWIHVIEWRANTRPGLTALVDDRGAAYTYAQLRAETERKAGGCAGLGIGPGDVVAIVAKNSADFLVHAFALMRAGATPAFVNWRLSPRELTEVLALVEPKAIAADAEFAGLVSAAWAAPLPRLVIGGGPVAEGWLDGAAISGLSGVSGSTAGRWRGLCRLDPRSPATRCWPWCTPAAPPAGPRPSRCGTAR